MIRHSSHWRKSGSAIAIVVALSLGAALSPARAINSQSNNRETVLDKEGPVGGRIYRGYSLYLALRPLILMSTSQPNETTGPGLPARPEAPRLSREQQDDFIQHRADWFVCTFLYFPNWKSVASGGRLFQLRFVEHQLRHGNHAAGLLERRLDA